MMADEIHQNSPKMLIENDQKFFSPIVSEQSPQPNVSKNGKKYQHEAVEMPAMPLTSHSKFPPKVNNTIWTSGRTDERRKQRQYRIRLLILAALMVFFIVLIVFSSVMLTIYTSSPDDTASNLSRHTGNNFRTPSSLPRRSTPHTENKQTIPTKQSLSLASSKVPISNNQMDSYITIKYPLETKIPKTVTDRLDEEQTTDTTSVKTFQVETTMQSFVSEIVTETMEIVDAETVLITVPSTSAAEEISQMANVDVYTTQQDDYTTKSIIGYVTQVLLAIYTTGAELEAETTLVNTPTPTTNTFGRNTGQWSTTNALTLASTIAQLKSTPPVLHTTETLRPTTDPPEPRCQPITINACRNIFPREFGTLSTSLEEIYNSISQSTDLSTCHVNANEVICSLYATPCDGKFFNLPCRSTCVQVAYHCLPQHDFDFYLIFKDRFCRNLPESSHKDICFPVSSASSGVVDNSCTNTFCLNGGSCFDRNGEAFCRCPDNYAGIRCNITFLRPEEELVFTDITEESESCQPISQEECSQILPYNQTLEVISSGTLQTPPWGVVAPVASCGDKAKLMFCAEIYPESECSPLERPPYIVCRSLCEEVQNECQFFFTALQFPLNCAIYPEASPDFICV